MRIFFLVLGSISAAANAEMVTDIRGVLTMADTFAVAGELERYRPGWLPTGMGHQIGSSTMNRREYWASPWKNTFLGIAPWKWQMVLLGRAIASGMPFDNSTCTSLEAYKPQVLMDADPYWHWLYRLCSVKPAPVTDVPDVSAIAAEHTDWFQDLVECKPTQIERELYSSLGNVRTSGT